MFFSVRYAAYEHSSGGGGHARYYNSKGLGWKQGLKPLSPVPCLLAYPAHFIPRHQPQVLFTPFTKRTPTWDLCLFLNRSPIHFHIGFSNTIFCSILLYSTVKYDIVTCSNFVFQWPSAAPGITGWVVLYKKPYRSSIRLQIIHSVLLKFVYEMLFFWLHDIQSEAPCPNIHKNME